MKIKIKLSEKRKEQITQELLKLGVEITEDTDLILTEEYYQRGELLCRDGDDTVVVPFQEIVYIESLGKDILVHTAKKTFTTAARLYVLEGMLPAEQFIRISNSVIIERSSIERIKPALSQKFYLILKNGDTVDVTRSYYYRFKEYYGI